MSSKTSKQLKTVKALELKQWKASFWLVKRKAVNRDASYNVLRVDIDSKLQNRFRGYLKVQLQSRDFHLAEYDFNNADGDDTLFTISADATDFTKVEQEINKGFDNPLVTKYDELLNSWAYVVLFENGTDRLYAWRKINAMTQPKKAVTQKATYVRNHKPVDAEHEEVFLIDPRFHFFVYDGTVLIANKREFESSMNFREGMKANAEEILKEFSELKFANNVEIIRKYVGDNLHHLRKLSSIRKAGYYKQDDYVKKMIEISTEEGWELKVENGQIIVEEDTVELLLKLLNNDRLRSPINNELFDAAAKALVSGKSKKA
ncbi:MAG: DUF4868 domain-containing protein [Uliginosibacterium sp.]|nr:DUF4868 domain-containing protein [Uliginosibacterium sp.]